MTQNRDFKALIRSRMVKTGERYTAARAQILRVSAGSGGGVATEARSSCGGVCSDTNALRRVLAESGVTAPHTGVPLSEAMLFGLCGGVGFLYAVFEYKNTPPLLSVLMRYDTVPDTFIAGGLERLGVPHDTVQTGSALKARQALDEALDEALDSGRPALCTIDIITLHNQHAGSDEYAGGAPDVVAVLSREGDGYLIDMGAAEPRRIGADHLAKSRAAYKKGKQRLVTIPGGATGPTETRLGAAVLDAVAHTADRYTNAPFKGFASNMGLRGMDKWRDLTTDAKDAKGWPRVFADGVHACNALRRCYQGIEHEFTAPAGGRPMYADFLAEGAELTGNAKLAEAGRAFARAGEAWRGVSGYIASCGVPEVETGCEMLDRYRELLDERAGGVPPEPGRSAGEAIDPGRALEIFAGLGERLGPVVEAEKAAHAALLEAAGG